MYVLGRLCKRRYTSICFGIGCVVDDGLDE